MCSTVPVAPGSAPANLPGSDSEDVGEPPNPNLGTLPMDLLHAIISHAAPPIAHTVPVLHTDMEGRTPGMEQPPAVLQQLADEEAAAGQQQGQPPVLPAAQAAQQHG